MTLFLVYGFNVENFHFETSKVFAQESDKSSESNKSQINDTFDKAKRFFGNIFGWIGDRITDYTDYVDELVDFESENKGPQALFGIPLYIGFALLFIFIVKLSYNIFRDMLKSIFSKAEEPPIRRSRPRSKQK